MCEDKKSVYLEIYMSVQQGCFKMIRDILHSERIAKRKLKAKSCSEVF